MMMKKITPIIPVANLPHAGAWFHEKLGFTATNVGDDMIHLSCDAVNIRLVRKADVDAFYAAHGPALEADGDDCAPFDRPYGMREMHIIYESLLMYFGSPIPAPAET